MTRAIVGWVLGLVARAWLATLRVRVEVSPELAAHADVPWVFAFFHGTQWPLLAWRRRGPTVVMVSHSADGAMQARALSLLGFSVVRGSSSRGGARGLAALVRRMRLTSAVDGRHDAGESKRPAADAAFAVDGPHGPYGEVKPGVLLAARAAGGVVVPMGGAVARGKVFSRAWDRFALAWPFTRVAVVLGAPMSASVGTEAVAQAIAAANDRAAAILTGAQAKVLASLGFSERIAETAHAEAAPSPFGIE